MILKKRTLGKAGLEVGEIGLGCWSFAGAYGPTDLAESHRTLAKARELGIDFLDTANVYGNGVSEDVIGAFIKDHPGDFKIATKGGIHRPPETNQRTFDNSSKHLREALEASLRRLGVEHVELYYIHRRESARPIEEAMETLVRFKEEGKIGGIGFSEISPTSLRRAHAVHRVTAVQSEYSLWTRQPELGMIQAAETLGVAFVPFSPLGRGIFSTKAPEPVAFGPQDFRKNNPRFLEPNFSDNLKAIQPFKTLAADLRNHAGRPGDRLDARPRQPPDPDSRHPFGKPSRRAGRRQRAFPRTGNLERDRCHPSAGLRLRPPLQRRAAGGGGALLLIRSTSPALQST